MFNEIGVATKNKDDRKFSGPIVIWVERPKHTKLNSNQVQSLLKKLTAKAKKNPKWRDDLVMDTRSARYITFREPPVETV